MAMSQDEILTNVREVLVDALAVDDDEVVCEARLVEDLGAESIDFLDITFRLEKSFDIKIEQGEMFPEAVLTDQNYVKEGKVTDEGMALLRQRLPYVDLDEFDSSRSVAEFSNIFTVQTLLDFVKTKLEAKE